MDEFNQIEQLASQLTEETKRILDDNFPLDSREFLESEDKSKVEQNDQRIVQLAKRYIELYRKLPTEEVIKRNFQNIEGSYNKQTHQAKGLIATFSDRDEYELHEAFSKAVKFGMMAIENIDLATKTNNQQLATKNQLVLKHCYSILSVHFWGKPREEYLERYKERLKKGRTIEDDLKDYDQLKNEAKKIAIDYAKVIINGITDQEKKQFNNKFNEIFAKEKSLTEFMTSDELNRVYLNLHWLKVDAERTPNKLLETEVQNISII